MDTLPVAPSSTPNYDERLRTVGIPVSELSDAHLKEICEGNEEAKASLKAA